VAAAARAAELATPAGFPREHLHALVAFVASSCRLSPVTHALEMEDRPRGRGEVEPGFRSRFDAWCRSNGHAPICLEGQLWAGALPPPARLADGVRVRMVCGGRWRDQAVPVLGACHLGPPGVNGPPSRSWYAFTLLSTLLHFAIVLGPMAVLLALAMRVQDSWARTMAPVSIHGRAPALFQHAFQPSLPAAASTLARAYLLPVVEAALLEAILFAALTALRLAVYYCELPEPRRGSSTWAALHHSRLGYAWLASAHVCAYVSLGAMSSCWLILGAALDPVRFLSYGTAVLTLFSVVYFVTAKLVATARAVRAALVARLMSLLASRLRLARIRMARARFTAQLVGGGGAADAARAELDALQREERALSRDGARMADQDGGLDQDEVDAVEIFDTLDADRSGGFGLSSGFSSFSFNPFSRASSFQPIPFFSSTPTGRVGLGSEAGLLLSLSTLFHALHPSSTFPCPAPKFHDSTPFPQPKLRPSSRDSILQEWIPSFLWPLQRVLFFLALTPFPALHPFRPFPPSPSGTLTTAELESLFDALELPIPARYKRSMFAQLDAQGDGSVSASEFEAGWAEMLESVLAQGLSAAGLSTLQIVLAVLTLALLLSLLIAFILVALAGWPRRTLESSVIESLLIAAVGAAASGRGRYQPEKATDELNRVVRETLDRGEWAVKAKRE
jgi:hypothetical protein